MHSRLSLFCLLLPFVLGPFAIADELRWSFDDLPAKSLVGDASVESIGPDGEHFEGLPEENPALLLDGNGDYVRVEDTGDSPLDFHQGDPITIEAWVRLDRIAGGQNVYVIGKGRTHRDGPKDNQNYALRLRGAGGEARPSFLFRSLGGEGTAPNWHRWTGKQGFGADGGWHHVAVSYRFGDPNSIRGYVDGKKVSGSWDMGGETEQPPVVDDDELWIGSSLGGSASNSFCGAIDEVAIHRSLLPANIFADRRIVITHPPRRPAEGLRPGTVTVAMHENVGDETTWPVDMASPLLRYEQDAFAIARMPVPYGNGGVRRDWQGPVLMTAMSEIELPPGATEWMLRAGGRSRFWINDNLVAETNSHLGPASGHGDVVPYSEKDPWLRPLRAGHHEEIVSHEIDREQSGTALVTLQTVVGGKSLRYEPGEIVVAYRIDPSDPWQVLTPEGGVPLTDEAWASLDQRLQTQVQAVDDRQRRIAASAEDEYWTERHRQARQWVESLPPLSVPPPIESRLSSETIDRFLDSRLDAAGRLNETTELTSDDEFIRRLYLDCLGVIPSIDEIDAFFAMPGEPTQRRSTLIERVLSDPRWADHWTAYWMDVLAENPNVLKPSLNNSGPFRWYLHDVLRDNVPIDRWVTGLVRMEGSTRYGGPAGFAMATQNDVPMAAKAHILSSAFLGANMKCARCHDAPYHDWTQRDLFSMAAMLGRKPIKVPASSSVPGEFFEGEEEGESLISLSVKPGEAVEAAWPLAEYTTSQPLPDSLLAVDDDSRERLAAQLTRPQNRQFAKTVVNRLWHRWMGEGIVEPVEDWEGADPSHPELLDYLARELTANRYDIKHVARLILSSHAYQRRAGDRKPVRDESERLFPSPRLRRMTAEQVVDSMHRAVGRPMDAGELTFDPEARMKPTAQANLGRPKRAWQLTSLSNERDRPALSLPKATAVTECLEAFGWTGARQDPVNHRQTAPNVIQPGILANGLLSIQLTRLIDGDAITRDCMQVESVDELVDRLFLRFLTRKPTASERQRFGAVLAEGFGERILATPAPAPTPIREPNVSWANHLHAEATEVRLRESSRLRLGPSPSRWLDEPWRERVEDSVWALINTPEFLFAN